jgi:hypothetical protein
MSKRVVAQETAEGIFLDVAGIEGVERGAVERMGPGRVRMVFDWPERNPFDTAQSSVEYQWACSVFVALDDEKDGDEELAAILEGVAAAFDASTRLIDGSGVGWRLMNQGPPFDVGADRALLRKDFLLVAAVMEVRGA